MRYYIVTYGCQMNISDSERVSAVLESVGYQKITDAFGADVSAEALAKADLIVVTMCSVRQSAVDRVHFLTHKFKELRKKNPKLKTVLTGCILKKDKKNFIKGFDYVVGIKEIRQLAEIARQQILKDSRRRASMVAAKRRGVASIKASEALAEGSVSEKIWLPSDYLSIVPKYTSKFSASVPIMTGCNNFCAYCVVPFTREREISRPAEEIISEIKNLVKKPARHNAKALGGGYKEIWLLGQNVNSYSNVLENNRIAKFPELLKMVNDIPGKFELNFLSSHPKDFSNELIKIMVKCKKLSRRLNLPIQSGDDEVLKKMNRPYTVAQYKNLVKKIRKAIPDIKLSTDVIVGFPGETKKQFENTVKVFKEISFGVAFINKYSPRPGTAAAKMKDDVPWEEKKRREKILIKLVNKK